MEDGRITEEGTHEELMEEKSGEYSRLIHTFHNSEDGLFIYMKSNLFKRR